MILVTGGTGLVGGHLLWHLLQENDRVVAIRRTSSNLRPIRTIFSFYTSNPDEYLARIEWRKADVLKPSSLQDALQGISIIYHCAAIVISGVGNDSLLDTNVIGTRNVVRAALETNVKKFCFVSSIAACGESDATEMIFENSIWTDNPNRSLYSRSKYYSEQEVWQGIGEGLNAIIVNPGVILGVSGNDTGSSQLFSQVQKGLLFYTNGGTGYVGVLDVAKAMLLLTKSKITGERFILVAENCSNKKILCWMADGLGKRRPFIGIGKKALWFVGLLSESLGKIFRFRPLIDRATARTATNRKYYSSNKIENSIGFTFTPIEQCISEACKFRLKN